MKQYLEMLQHVRTHGELKNDRTGTGTYAVFGYQFRHQMDAGFPLLTTKKMFTRGIIHELLWFIKGDTNVKYLQENGVTIWDEWARNDGSLGPVYGKQWRDWEGVRSGNVAPHRHHVDQLAQVIETIKRDPWSRRLVVSAWNVIDLPDMALTPCHCLFQFNCRPMSFYVRRALLRAKRPELVDILASPEAVNRMDAEGIPKFYLDLQLYQRSADIFLGVPFNIASYALLLQMVARVTGTRPGTFVHTFGDLHLYTNHVEQADEQLKRAPLPLPRMKIAEREITSINDFVYTDFELEGYECLPAIKAPIAV